MLTVTARDSRQRIDLATINKRLVCKSLRAGCCAVAITLAAITGSFGVAQTFGTDAAAQKTKTEFEAATIKLVKEPDPNRMNDREEGRRLTTHNTTLNDLVMMAYRVDRRQIVGAPGWMTADEYDVDAVAGTAELLDKQGLEMFKSLLADRFKLTFHGEQREMPVYTLVVANGGPKLKAAEPNGEHTSGCEHLGQYTFRGEPVAHFARWLQFVVSDKPVVDKTGLTGEFDFTLRWTPDESQFFAMGIHAPAPSNDPNAAPELFPAMQEQLGLKLRGAEDVCGGAGD